MGMSNISYSIRSRFLKFLAWLLGVRMNVIPQETRIITLVSRQIRL